MEISVDGKKGWGSMDSEWYDGWCEWTRDWKSKSMEV